jgi:hypothetical protein
VLGDGLICIFHCLRLVRQAGGLGIKWLLELLWQVLRRLRLLLGRGQDWRIQGRLRGLTDVLSLEHSRDDGGLQGLQRRQLGLLGGLGDDGAGRGARRVGGGSICRARMSASS